MDCDGNYNRKELLAGSLGSMEESLVTKNLTKDTQCASASQNRNRPPLLLTLGSGRGSCNLCEALLAIASRSRGNGRKSTEGKADSLPTSLFRCHHGTLGASLPLQVKCVGFIRQWLGLRRFPMWKQSLPIPQANSETLRSKGKVGVRQQSRHWAA